MFFDGIRCCLPYKGTNFSANHNVSYKFMQREADVVYPTKVRIFQQITTEAAVMCIYARMLFTLQRYEFFSKSQLIFIMCSMCYGCCLPYKGTNFSANHNALMRSRFNAIDVVYPTKVRIFQQITTNQNYTLFFKRCCLPYKGTNFSANHNTPRVIPIRQADVVYPTKVRIFQQITTLQLLL